MGFLDRARKALNRARQSIANRIAPPPLPTEPPRRQPGRTPRDDRGVDRPPRTTRYLSRADMPAEWGRNQAGLWRDAVGASEGAMDGRDELAQRFYEAALYTRGGTHEERRRALDNFKQYVEDTYGVDWDDIFDWEDYRANYDIAVG